MIDVTLQELWTIKEKIAKEHEYDLDKLVNYLRQKYQTHTKVETIVAAKNSESTSTHATIL